MNSEMVGTRGMHGTAILTHNFSRRLTGSSYLGIIGVDGRAMLKYVLKERIPGRELGYSC
jgi:hypothetical protein